MDCFKLNKKGENAEITALFGPEQSVWLSKILRWFGHVKRKDGGDLVKRCMTMEGDARVSEEDVVEMRQ